MSVQGLVQLAGRTGQLCAAGQSWSSARGWPATLTNAKEAISVLRPAFDKIMTIYCSTATTYPLCCVRVRIRTAMYHKYVCRHSDTHRAVLVHTFLRTLFMHARIASPFTKY